jgi:hypothetical protein
MPYANASDVARLNKARRMGEGNNPTASDVGVYCELVGFEIDGILVNKGYNVPVSSNYPEAFGYLRWLNAKGALVMMEEASPNSVILARATESWQNAREALRTARTVMDVPQETVRTEPRGPGVTKPELRFNEGEVYDPNQYPTQPESGTANPEAPYLSRALQF